MAGRRFRRAGASLEPGMPFALEWFLPETQSGKVQEKSFVLRMSGIAAMQGAAIDRSLVPDVKGVTDEKSIADWDPPFPFDSQRVRSTAPHDEDDRYWKEFGATPKAFVSIARGREMAASRFGHSTAWHVPLKALASSSDTSLELLRQTLASRIDPQALGWRIDAVRSMAIEAASGTTPFAGLFGVEYVCGRIEPAAGSALISSLRAIAQKESWNSCECGLAPSQDCVSADALRRTFGCNRNGLWNSCRTALDSHAAQRI